MAYKEKDTKKWTAQWFETNVRGEKKKRRKRGFETKREALEFERNKKLSYYLMFEILFWTGCRIGELLAITKADINFEKNQLNIDKTYYRTGKKDVITEPKTKQSVRIIEIPGFLKKEIQEFVDRHYGMADTQRLFPVVQEAVQHKMKRQIKVAGVKKIRVHDLRHSHVAYLIEKGVEPLLIKERLGHKDIRITLNTYGHLYPNQQRKVANLLDEENQIDAIK